MQCTWNRLNSGPGRRRACEEGQRLQSRACCQAKIALGLLWFLLSLVHYKQSLEFSVQNLGSSAPLVAPLTYNIIIMYFMIYKVKLKQKLIGSFADSRLSISFTKFKLNLKFRPQFWTSQYFQIARTKTKIWTTHLSCSCVAYRLSTMLFLHVLRILTSLIVF